MVEYNCSATSRQPLSHRSEHHASLAQVPHTVLYTPEGNMSLSAWLLTSPTWAPPLLDGITANAVETPSNLGRLPPLNANPLLELLVITMLMSCERQVNDHSTTALSLQMTKHLRIQPVPLGFEHSSHQAASILSQDGLRTRYQAAVHCSRPLSCCWAPAQGQWLMVPLYHHTLQQAR